MNIFISYSHADSVFALRLSSVLETDGYDVFVDNKIPIGNNIYKDIGEGIAKADVVIPIISPNSNNSTFVRNETVSMLSFFDKGKMPLVIPIVIGKDTSIPIEISRFNYLVIPYDDESSAFSHLKDSKTISKLNEELENDAINNVRLIAAAHYEKINKAKEEKLKSETKVKHELSKYIEGVFSTLRENEKRNKKAAFWYYGISIFSLLATIIVISLMLYQLDLEEILFERLIVLGIISLIIAVILVSLSKLLFTLAKSFMVESIRCSDRIHAI